MNLAALSAEIARRIPEMSRDSQTNNAEVIERLIREETGIFWNPGNKVVQSHRDGTIDHEETNRARAARGLPVPWTAKMAERETRQPDIP